MNDVMETLMYSHNGHTDKCDTECETSYGRAKNKKRESTELGMWGGSGKK
jgi:hypothetical protein